MPLFHKGSAAAATSLLAFALGACSANQSVAPAMSQDAMPVVRPVPRPPRARQPMLAEWTGPMAAFGLGPV